ncbi:MAG: SRPBCC domain-containing protein [Bacteroidota bacterium]
MQTQTPPLQEGVAQTTKTTFTRTTAVQTLIHADPTIIWALLTNASDFNRWNSTVVSIEGQIRLGETIKLKSTLDEKRTFKLKVKGFTSEQQLVWGDGQGERVYTLEPVDANTIRFSMTERIGGLMFPLYGRFIPSFDASFEQFAADLKAEAEHIQQSQG